MGVFGGVTAVWEVSDDTIETVPSILRAQAWLAQNARLLAIPWCLALFYLYLGALQTSLHGYFSFGGLIGWYFILLGSLNMGIHLGYDVTGPTQAIAGKIKGAAAWLKLKINGEGGSENGSENEGGGGLGGGGKTPAGNTPLVTRRNLEEPLL